MEFHGTGTGVFVIQLCNSHAIMRFYFRDFVLNFVLLFYCQILDFSCPGQCLLYISRALFYIL